MGHELVIHGAIEGATWRSEDFRALQAQNEMVLSELPKADNWPQLVGDMFALPAPEPIGTYRTQVIHFGASFKEEGRDALAAWLKKFENLLSKMWWHRAKLIANTERSERVYSWEPESSWSTELGSMEPSPVARWKRQVREL